MTIRLTIDISEEMNSELEHFAKINHRSKANQVLEYIEVGMKTDPKNLDNVITLGERPKGSDPSTINQVVSNNNELINIKTAKSPAKPKKKTLGIELRREQIPDHDQFADAVLDLIIEWWEARCRRHKSAPRSERALRGSINALLAMAPNDRVKALTDAASAGWMAVKLYDTPQPGAKSFTPMADKTDFRGHPDAKFQPFSQWQLCVDICGKQERGSNHFFLAYKARKQIETLINTFDQSPELTEKLNAVITNLRNELSI